QPRARMTSKESCMTRIVTGLSRTAPVFTLALPCERSNNGLSEKSSMLLKWHRLPACVSWSVNAEMVEPLPRSARRWTMESQRAPSMPETREIVRSTRAADRIAAARAWLAAAPAAAEVLVVAPTREAADDLVRELAAARGAVAGIHRLTPGRLAGLLAAEVTASSCLAPATELAAQAIAARAVFHFVPSGKLKHFAPVADRPGFAEALARTIAELRLNNVGARALARIGDGGAELALLLARFDEELAAARLIDRAGMLAI